MKRKIITVRRIFQAGSVNFVRNLSLAAAAIAIEVVTLTLILFSFLTNAAFNHTVTQITDKIDISVFLQDSVSNNQAEAFVKQIKAQPDVRSVSYLNKQQALENYISQDSNNQQLVTAATEAGNPIPSTILVFPKNLNYVPSIQKFLTKPGYQAMQISGSPSYNGDQKVAIDNITHATNTLRKIGVIIIVVFIFISALIIFYTIQMTIFNRRDEITIQRLLGASTSYIRGPYVVENMIYGIIAALVSILIISITFKVSANALQSSSFGLIDITYANQYFSDRFWLLLTGEVVSGIFIGTVFSAFATRRYLKFKTK